MSVSIIPDSAPFTAEQRSWLNGFLAGWAGVSVDGHANGDGASLAAGPSTGLSTGLLPAPNGAAAAEDEEDFPWHDPALEMQERLKLADEKPLKRKLMAAMAQLDCGACGYVCQTYAEAIAAGDEKNLTLCSPGGKETAKMLKKMIKEGRDAPANGASANGKAANGAATNGAATNGAATNGAASNGVASNGAPFNGAAFNGSAINGAATNGAARPAANGYSRTSPFFARVKACENLNRGGSSKHTTHVEIDLAGSGLDYVVGDALGVFPTNCSDLVDQILPLVGAGGDEAARKELLEKRCLRSVSDELLELLASNAANAAEKADLEGLIDSDELDVVDVLDVLRRAPSASITAEQLLDCLTPLAPRLYSIASSIKAHPGEVHLTVGRAAVEINDRVYKGVASTMFAERIGPGDKVGVYVHKSHGFTVPADPAAPMIMVGPGTGVAPFRAFLEERAATAAPGKNWLFFGDQHSATDFLYEGQVQGWVADGVLTKLSTAFSRDQETKVYVQDRMREEGAELFAWLEQGGYFFVCGDARRMAVDVDRALHDVVATHGGLSDADAKAYVDRLKAEHRYVRDVY